MIEDAKNLDELMDIGRRMKRTKELSPPSKDKLQQVGASRRVELEQAVPA